MRKIFILALLLFSCALILRPARAQEPVPIPAPALEKETNAYSDVNPPADQQDQDEDKKAIDKINEVVQKIYDRIIAAKAKYKELAGFDEKCLSKNSGGFLTLKYETQVPSVRGESFPYAFMLDVEPLKSKTYKAHDGYFEYTLPLLDVQFSGYAIKHPIRRQFDIENILEEYAEDLADYQQQFMPLRFMIMSDKSSFRVNEPIKFKVILANTTEYSILVNSLGKESLFFTLNRNVWGTESGEMETLSPREQRRQERIKRDEIRDMLRKKRKMEKEGVVEGKRTHVGEQIILRAGEALVIDFTGEGYRRAQDVDIRGIYQLNYKGLRPTGKITLKIVKE